MAEVAKVGHFIFQRRQHRFAHSRLPDRQKSATPKMKHLHPTEGVCTIIRAKIQKAGRRIRQEGGFDGTQPDLGGPRWVCHHPSDSKEHAHEKEETYMMRRKSGILTRRNVLKSSAALAATAVAGSGVSLFNVRSAYSQDLPNPADVLAKINVGNMVKKEYRDQYKLGDNDELWDSSKDWIRTVDWEAVRKEHSGKTVRFAVGAADRESAEGQTQPFADLSGIKIDVVAIPDDSMYDKVVAEFLSGNAGFDAIQFFSPWLGDFAAQGFLKPLDEYVAKWKLPFDDFYETYQRNYGHWGDKGILGIPFDCDIQQVHIRPSIFKKIGIEADRVK
ncbi:MAG: ABC transporter substrate-binding protein, partial [Aestuariivirga sp.]